MWINFIILCISAWISFVKSSIQAAGGLMAIFLLVALTKPNHNLLFLFLSTVFLMITSLLIPKPNPRHQKRRFRITRMTYSMLFLVFGFFLYQNLNSRDTSKIPSLDPELLTLLGPLSFLVFVSSLMLVRKNAS